MLGGTPDGFSSETGSKAPKADRNEMITRIESALLRPVKFQPSGIRSITTHSELFKDRTIVDLGISLPSLRNAPLGLVHRLRKDYSDLFDHFQRHFARSLRKVEGEPDEKAFQKAIETITGEVEALNRELRKIKKKHPSLQLGAATIDGIVVICCPSRDIANTLNNLLSGVIGAGLLGWAVTRDQKIELSDAVNHHPLQFPVKVAKELDWWAA